MRKIISFILACVLCVVAMPVLAFADVQANDNLFGVIIDAEGNVVEVLTMPRTNYVNEIRTIPPGGSYVSYQYEPSKSFFFGFVNTDFNKKVITDSRCTFDLSIETSNTIGSDGKVEWHSESVKSDGSTMFFEVKSYTRRYCNGVLKNTSSYSANVRIIVVLDEELDDCIKKYMM